MARKTWSNPASAGNSFKAALCTLLTIIVVVAMAIGAAAAANHFITPHSHHGVISVPKFK